MSERERLRDKLATVVGAYDKADAVLAVLDQQGWVSPEQLADDVQGDTLWRRAVDRIMEQRDAALREAARYEQVRGRLQERLVMARDVLDKEGYENVAALVPIEEVLIWMDEADG